MIGYKLIFGNASLGNLFIYLFYIIFILINLLAAFKFKYD